MKGVNIMKLVGALSVVSFIVGSLIPWESMASAAKDQTEKEFFMFMPAQFTEEFCLAKNIFFEAGIDTLAGKAAVADVVLNRVEDPRYPDTVCGVVYQAYTHANGEPIRNKCQFSWFCDGKSDRIPTGAKNWIDSQNVAWEMMFEGKFHGITEGSTHYHTPAVNPYWADSSGMDMSGVIGAHIFYKWGRK